MFGQISELTTIEFVVVVVQTNLEVGILKRWPQMKCAGNDTMHAYGAMFHHFHDARHIQAQGSMSAEDFGDFIEHVGRRNILSADEWMKRALHDDLGDRDVCLTFDDALLCQFEIALPVMRDLGLTAFWFVYSSVFEGKIESLEVYRHFRMSSFADICEFYVVFTAHVKTAYPDEYRKVMEGFNPDAYLAAYPFYTKKDLLFRFLRDDMLGSARYHATMQKLMAQRKYDVDALKNILWMNDKHLQALHQDGHVIGLHSYSHPTRMKELSREAQAKEFGKNFQHLEAVLGERPKCMAHPCNSYNADTLSVLEGLGVRLGFRANMAPIQRRTALEFNREDHANIMQEMHG